MRTRKVDLTQAALPHSSGVQWLYRNMLFCRSFCQSSVTPERGKPTHGFLQHLGPCSLHPNSRELQNQFSAKLEYTSANTVSVCEPESENTVCVSVRNSGQKTTSECTAVNKNIHPTKSPLQPTATVQ